MDLDALWECKTKAMIHCNPSKCNIIDEGEYVIYGTKLEQLTHTKYLGILFDPNLKWIHHTDMVVKNATPMLGFVHHNIHSCPKSLQKIAYKSLDCFDLEYGATVCDPYIQKDTSQWAQYVETMWFTGGDAGTM